MRLAISLSLLIAISLLSTCHGRDFNLIRLHSDHHTIPEMNCNSWRWAVETNNGRDWRVVPERCVDYIKQYMDGEELIGKERQYVADYGEELIGKERQYVADCYMVANYIEKHLLKTKPAQNGKDIWIFDLDETLLSDLPYYRRPEVQYGAKPYNRTMFYEWVATGEVPGLDPFVELYNKVLEKGFKIVIISGTSEDYRDVRETNLRNIGVDNWERLILRPPSKRGESALKFKQRERTWLGQDGYRIVVNIGDQWSDITGSNPGRRTFKVPNPMYYVG